MKPPQRSSFPYEAVFGPMIIIPWLNQGTPMDATAARNVLIFRSVISLIGTAGLIWAMIYRARTTAKTPPVPGTDARPAAPSATNPWDSREAQTALSVSYQTNRASFARMQWKSLKSRPINFVGWGVFLLIPIVIVVALDLDKGSFSILTIGKALLAALGVAGFFAGVIYLEFRSRFPRADSVRNCTTYLSRDGLHDVTPSGVAYFPWSKIKAIENWDSDLYFVTSGSTNCFIPREAFSGPESAARFFDAAQILWRSKGAETPPAALTAEFSHSHPAASDNGLKMPLPFDLGG